MVRDSTADLGVILNVAPPMSAAAVLGLTMYAVAQRGLPITP
jgi:hypothetical protein